MAAPPMDFQDHILDSPSEIFYSANTSPVRSHSAVPSIEVTVTEVTSNEDTDDLQLDTSLSNFTTSPVSVYTLAVSAFCMCGNPAEGRCDGCMDTPGQSDKYYCSAACLKTDQHLHAQVCKSINTLRTVHRAAECLQDVYYMYRAKTFDRKIIAIHKTEELGRTHLVAHEDTSILLTNGPQLFHKLPFKLFEEEWQDDEDNGNVDKRAILTHGAGLQSFVWMHDLIGYFLKDCAMTLKEQRIMPMQGNRSVLFVNNNLTPDLTPREHLILAITLHNAAGTFALDLCGAQYGFFDPLVPYSEYAVRGSPISRPGPWTGEKSVRNSVEALRKEKSRRGALVQLNMLASEKLVSGAVEWEKEYGTRISTMLQARQAVYENRKEGLIHYLAYEVQTRLDSITYLAAADTTSATVSAPTPAIGVGAALDQRANALMK